MAKFVLKEIARGLRQFVGVGLKSGRRVEKNRLRLRQAREDDLRADNISVEVTS